MSVNVKEIEALYRRAESAGQTDLAAILAAISGAIHAGRVSAMAGHVMAFVTRELEWIEAIGRRN